MSETDTTDTVTVCPECDRTGVVSRQQAAGDDYRCNKCMATFDTPSEREPLDNPVGSPHAADGLPTGLSPAAKEQIRELRSGD